MGASHRLLLRGRPPLDLSTPRVMAVVNVTPDSFSDGGECATADAATKAAMEALDAGAAIVDLGGESTRPGAAAVGVDEELERVLPPLRAIMRLRPDAVVSIDTTKAAVARACLDEGAAMLNDVSGLAADPELARVVAESGAPIVLGHRRGTPSTMHTFAHYGDVVAEVVAELRACADRARAAGIADAQLLADPGLGFAKDSEHNWQILARLREFDALGIPLVIGPSRKRFLGELLGGRAAKGRDAATIACVVTAAIAGARIVRVHAAADAADALRVVARLLQIRVPSNA